MAKTLPDVAYNVLAPGAGSSGAWPHDSVEPATAPLTQTETARSDVRGAIMTPPMNIATAAQPRRMGRIAASVKCVTGVTREVIVTLHTLLSSVDTRASTKR